MVGLWVLQAAAASGVLFDPLGYAPALRLDALVQIEGRIETATLTWRFEPTAGDRWGFAQIVPPDAAVVALRYRQGDAWVEASAQPAAQPPASPEGAGAPLPGAFQAQLPPLEEAPLEVQLSWQRVLTTAADRLSSTIPLDDGGLSPTDPAVEVQLSVASGAELLQPGWTAGPVAPTDGPLVVRWTGALSEHDALTLSWGEPPAPFGIRLFTYRPEHDPFTDVADPDGYGLVLLQPGAAGSDVRVDQLFTFVVDTSASMDGPALEAAIEASARWLRALRPVDRFDVVSYASVARPFRARAPLARPEAIEDAVAFLRRQQPLGLSDPEEALTTALQLMDDTVQQRSFFSCAGTARGEAPGPPQPGQPVITRAGADARIAPYVVLITDGGATTGIVEPEAIVASVASANTVGASVFTVGVGPQADQALLERLAAAQRGASAHARTAEQVDALLAAVAEPVLVQPRLRSPDLTQPAPEVLRDVGAGHEVLMAFRYPTPGEASLQLTGIRGPADLDERYPITLPGHAPELPAIARAWAQLRVADLDARHQRGEDVYTQIVSLVEAYGVASEVVSLGFGDPETSTPGATPTSSDASACGCSSARIFAAGWPLLAALLLVARLRRARPGSGQES